ncbi:hypothetical protein EMCRGX_G020277 [Ephydatia muelleri]
MDEYQENVQEVVDDEDQDDEDQEGVQDIVDDDDTADKRFGKRLAAAKKRLAGAGKILADARSDLAAARSDLAAADKRLADAEAKEKEERDEGYIKECRVYVNKCQQHVTTMQKFLEEAASKVCPSAKKLRLDAAYIVDDVVGQGKACTGDQLSAQIGGGVPYSQGGKPSNSRKW